MEIPEATRGPEGHTLSGRHTMSPGGAVPSQGQLRDTSPFALPAPEPETHQAMPAGKA